jgi:hypothetical protein
MIIIFFKKRKRKRKKRNQGYFPTGYPTALKLTKLT